MGFLKRTFSGDRTLNQGTGATFESQELFKDPNLEANKQLLAGRIGGIESRGPLGTSGLADQTAFRQGQLGLAEQLAAQSRGEGPSLADAQLQRGLQGNIESQLALAASQRGNQNTGALARGLAGNVARAQQETVAQSGLQRLAEQQQSQQLLGQVLGSGRGQDIQTGQLQVQEQAQKDALIQQYVGAGLSLDQAQFQANQDLAKLKLQNAQFNAGLQQQRLLGKAENTQKADAAIFQAAGSAAGAAAAASDANLKTEIRNDKKSIDGFLKAINPKSYKYKDTGVMGTAPGQRYGILAQDIEKSDAGKSVVFETKQGKMIDTNQSIGLIFAALGRLNQKLERKK